MRVLITGGAGFIGHHMVEHFLKNTDWDLIILDRLTYAANGLSRLHDVQAFDERQRKRVQFFPIDITQSISVGVEKEIGSVDYLIHLAAETHVDNSISDPRPFVMSNVVGTMELLQFARRLHNLQKFVYFSTDEVFGPAPNGYSYKENDRYDSRNPYSASKAAGEELCMAWSNTYKLPVIVTHCMNAFGERQHPEKFIPMVVRKILRKETITIHADVTRTKAGSRHYIHCRNIAAGLLFLLDHAKGNINNGFIREKFNIVGEREIDNLALVQLIHSNLEAATGSKWPLQYELVDFHGSRPGHDLRYALSAERLRKLGWSPPNTFEQSLEKCIRWMIEPANFHWLTL